MSGRGGKFKRGGFKSAAYIKKKRSSPGEDDTASRASKKAKAEEEDEEDESTPFVPTLKKDEQGDSYVGLKSNDMRRVTVNEFKGKTMIHIREFYTDAGGKVLPGRKGISLTLEQYNAFVAALPILESVLTKRGDEVVRPDYEGEAAKGGVEEEEAKEEVDDDEEEDE